MATAVKSVDVEAEVIEIATSKTANQISKPELDDNRKRWLIIGICMHNLMAPALRQHVGPFIEKVYENHKKKSKIHRQTQTHFKKKYGSWSLNYLSINNNANAQVTGCDYRVKNAVDFSKLFLEPHMAQYTGFDDSCDMSALLTFLKGLPNVFPYCDTVAKKLNNDIRNKWAHPNFTEWTDFLYMNAFQLMNQLLGQLQMEKAKEKALLADLSKWEKYGIHFLQGISIDLDLLRILKTETKTLATYVIGLKTSVDESLKHVWEELNKISTEITLRIDQIDQKQKALSESIDTTNQRVCGLEDFAMQTKGKLDKFEEQLSEDRADITAIKERVLSKPNWKPLFYPPNKIDVFVGRKWELQKLSKCMNSEWDCQHVDVISGLGGCGKTTLAIEYAWNYHETYPAGVFWMSADSDESLDNSIVKLAIDIGMEGCEFRDTFYKVLKWLSSLEQRWLLVIDNLDCDEISKTAKELISGVWSRKSKGHTIVTTRREPKEVNGEFQIEEEHCVVVNVLTKQQSIEFLRQRSGKSNNDCDQDSLEELATELAGLPLALEQAAAHIKNLNCSFKEYTDKFKAIRLKLPKSARSSFATEKMRQTVQTTWRLNFDYILKHSEEEGLGNAAYTVMQISSFLYSDLIPIEIFNSGEPRVNEETLNNALSYTVGIKQIISILTRFSLFQQKDKNLLSIHRLVQEVVRDTIQDKEHQRFIMESAIRMINSALKTTTKPHEMLCVDVDISKRRGSLFLWGLLAVNSSSLRNHVTKFVQANNEFQNLLLNIESVYLCQTSAVYHSVHQNQNQALAEQKEMLSVLTSLDIPKEQFSELTSIKLPLYVEDCKILRECMASTQDNHDNETVIGNLLDIQTLREKGNHAFRREEYSNAIQYYSEAIRASYANSLDWRLFSNRSLAHLKLHNYSFALSDAEESIKQNPNQFKPFCWKAYAIAGLIKQNEMENSWKCVGLAAAAVAAKLNPVVLHEHKMKVSYPLVRYNVLEPSNDLSMIITHLEHPFMTLLLKKGVYKLENFKMVRNVQVVGIDNDVKIQVGNALTITLLEDEAEKTLSVHFENIVFEGNGSVTVASPNVLATFDRCKFFNGMKACKQYPCCDFGEGCVDPEKCKTIGIKGSSGLICCNQGKVYLDGCIFDKCGGGGAVVSGEGSILEIKLSIVRFVSDSGLTVDNGGFMSVKDSFIIKNQVHGIYFGLNGKGIVSGNFVCENGKEGILASAKCLTDESKICKKEYAPIDVSHTQIKDNRIGHNGLSGISLNGGVYQVIGNSIFENLRWGIMIQSRSSAQVLNNNIYENKFGGILVGHNYSATVQVDGNTIHDQNGPPFKILPIIIDKDVVRNKHEEVKLYTKPPIITSRNVFQNNNRKAQHIIQPPLTLPTCCHCHKKANNLKKCSKCKKAWYCSKKCQKNHWKRHKHLCKILETQYTVEVKLSDTKPCNLLPLEDRKSCQQFIVVIQGQDYTHFDQQSYMRLHNQDRSLDINFKNATIYNMLLECGFLNNDLYSKKLFMLASFKNDGDILCLFTDNLPEYQEWP